MRSMTGYGRSSLKLENLEIITEITSLNKKNLEVSISLPREWQYMEIALIKKVRDFLHRGKINVTIKCKQLDKASDFPWDEEFLESALDRVKTFCTKRNLEFQATPDFFISLLRLTDSNEGLKSDENILSHIDECLNKALEQLVQMRKKEGLTLAEDISARIDSLRKHTFDIEEKSSDCTSEYRKQLLDRLSLAELDINLNDERILKEIALYAEKCDITEELVRLKAHLDHFKTELKSSESVGRKLDFICQEINREFNTISNKTNKLEVIQLVIESKNELEKVREQTQNLE